MHAPTPTTSAPALPFGEPTPLGLLGLAIGCGALVPIAFGMIPSEPAKAAAMFSTAAWFCLVFGGGCQFLAGVMSLANKNTLGGTLFTTFSFNWVMNWYALSEASHGRALDPTVGFAVDITFVVIFIVLTYAFGFYSKLLFAFLVDIDALYLLRIARHLLGHGHAAGPALGIGVGIATILLIALALYIAFALLVNPAAGRAVFPTGGALFRAATPPASTAALLVLAILLSSTATARAQSEPTDVQHGLGFGCGLTSRGEVRCWGANDRGQLGRGGSDGTTHDAATVVGLPDAARAIAVGNFHACTAQTDGRVWCWGRNDDGQLGDGTTVDHGAPAAVPGVVGAIDVAAANEWTCALLGAGGVTCWGANDYQQLAVRGLERRSTPGAIPRVRDAVELSVGAHHACVRHRNGSVSCWGGNEYAQSATGRRGAPAPVHRVTGVAHAAEIEVGETFSCARVDDGSVLCWGQNVFGSSDPMAAVYARPTPMVGVVGALDLSAHSAEDVCALVGGGAVWCTGVSRDGQIFRPDDSSTMRALPTLAGVGRAARVRVSGPVVCVWNQTGAPLCWGGSGASTALGTGARAPSPVPATLRGF